MDPLTLQGFLCESKDVLSIQTRPLAEDYDMDAKPFARGKFATVRRCRHRASGREFAAKCMRKRRRVDVRHEIVHEALVLAAAAKCTRIVSLHDIFETAAEMVLLLDMVPGGELQRVIDDEVHIPEREAARLMKQILEGLSHLHDKNIAHLDLKPQNILLTAGFPHCNIKLCDFGISRLIEGGVEIREINGTPDYVAPEVLQYEPIGLATDMWSVGVLAYVLLSGHTPFGGDSKQETFCNITNGQLDFPLDLFGHASLQAKDFIRCLLKRNPRDRPTVHEALQHPWLNLGDSAEVPCNGDVSLILSSPPIESVHVHNGVHDTPSESCNGHQEPVNGHSVGQVHIVDREELPAKFPKLLKTTRSGIPKLQSLERCRQSVSIVPVEAVQEETMAPSGALTAPLTPLVEPREKAHLCEEKNERIVPVLVEFDNRSSVVHPTSSGLRRIASHDTSTRAGKDILSSSLNKAMSEMENMVVELKEGLALTKRLMFSDDILVDERMGIVY